MGNIEQENVAKTRKKVLELIGRFSSLAAFARAAGMSNETAKKWQADAKGMDWGRKPSAYILPWLEAYLDAKACACGGTGRLEDKKTGSTEECPCMEKRNARE